MSGGVAIHTELFSRARCEARRRKGKRSGESVSKLCARERRNCAHRRTRRRLLFARARGRARRPLDRRFKNTIARNSRNRGLRVRVFFASLIKKPPPAPSSTRDRTDPCSTVRRRFRCLRSLTSIHARDARPQCADSHWCSSPRPRAPPPPARARLGAPSRPTRRLASSAPPRASRPPARVLSRGRGAFADPRGPSRALPPAAASPASLTAPRSRHGVVRARRLPRRAALPGAARRTPPRGSLARPPPRPPALSPRRRRASRARRLGRGTHLRRGGG